MPLEVQRIGRDTRPQLNLLVYGMPGVGKTTLAAQAQSHPLLAPVLVADLEGGLLSVSSRGDIDAVPIRTTVQLDELFWALKNGRDGFDKYRTVIIDSGTNLANRALQEWTATNIQRAQSRGRNVNDRTLDDVQLEDYGKTTNQVRRLIEWYRDLPVNLIVTALARFEYPHGADTKTTEPVSVGPDFTAKLAMNVSGMMDMVWFMYTDEEDNRYILTRERGIYRAKTRGSAFPAALGAIVKNPNLVDIYDLLLKTESPGEDAYEPASIATAPAEESARIAAGE